MEEQIPVQTEAPRSDYLESRMFRKRLTGLGMALVGYYLLALAATPLVSVITAMVTLFGADAGSPAVQEALMWSQQICLSAFMLLLPFGIYSKLFGYRIGRMFGRRKATGALFFGAATAGMGLCMVASLAAGFVTNLFTSLTGLPGSMEMPVPKTIPGTVLFVLAVAVEAPILEEYVFRGVILQSLRPFGSSFAILVSAVFFALLHGNVAQGVGTVLMGLVFGFLAIKSESLLPSILLHALNNTLACVEMLVQDRLGPDGAAAFEVFQVVLMSTVLLVGLIALAILVGRNPGFLKLEEPRPRLPFALRRTLFFKNPTIILFFIAAAGSFVVNMITMSLMPELPKAAACLGGFLW